MRENERTNWRMLFCSAEDFVRPFCGCGQRFVSSIFYDSITTIDSSNPMIQSNLLHLCVPTMQPVGLSVSVPYYNSRFSTNPMLRPISTIALNFTYAFSKSITPRPKSSYVICSQKNRDGDGHDDGFYMRKSVELARKGLGYTSPNPLVGCVVVKHGQIVGQGFHPKPGQPHAEVFALRDAGDLAEDATVYVSLEPCNHFGRTPPCTVALIEARVKKVVIGMVDPNPIVASKGVDRLRGAGIQVVVGVEEELCKSLNEGYIHSMLTGKPLLTLRSFDSTSIFTHILQFAFL